MENHQEKTLRCFIHSLFIIFITTFAYGSDSNFPPLDADLKSIADQIPTIDHNIATQDISAGNVEVYISNILKAIDQRDKDFFAKIKSCEAIGMDGLTCLAKSINEMAPALRDKMKGALKHVVPLIGYGAHTVDLFID